MHLSTCLATTALILLAAPALADGGMITGAASYRERIALPDTASLEVELVALSVSDERARIVAGERVAPAGQVPIPFAIAFDASAIAPGIDYAVEARIAVDGEPWFATQTPYALDPLGAELPVELLLARVASAAEPGAPEEAAEEPEAEPDDGNGLFGVTWRLVELDDSPVPEEVTTTLILDGEGGLGGNGGCNTYGGSVTVEGENIEVSNVFSTMMACPEPAMGQERGFFNALEASATYAIEAGELRLLGEDGTVLARLQQAAAPGEP